MAQAAAIQGKVDGVATSPVAKAQDFFYWVGRINMASTVVGAERGILPKDQVSTIARGVAHSIEQGARPDGKRPTDVLQIEKIITDEAGQQASLIHSGRSRQDMHATMDAARLRTAMLDLAERLDEVRARMLDLATEHVETFVPAYTNGVQAMPISLAHYLLAFHESFGRDAQRIREAWPRINRSALGTAVLANSSWPLDRERLATLLGFDAPIVNSYDAGQISTYDIPIEAAGIAGSIAIRVGALMQDLHVQYHQVRPWILLDRGKTYTSSAMPQKANPGIIQNTRGKASDVVASAQAVTLRAHNVTPGMTDYKRAWDERGARTFVLGVDMLRMTADTLAALRIDPQRALEELESEWTTSMELAETLQRQHAVPFRVGHHFASEVVVHAREKGYRPKEFPYSEAVKIYAESLKDSTGADGASVAGPDRLPLDEGAFRDALSPAHMVRTRVGLGGPQPDEVRRMLAEAQQALDRDRDWLAQRRTQLAQAEAVLNGAFESLLEPQGKR